MVADSKQEISLRKLEEVLKSLFQGEFSVVQINSLSLWEKQILSAIIERKFGKKMAIEQLRSGEIFERVDDLLKSYSNKRPEENYKFVFKKCLK